MTYTPQQIAERFKVGHATVLEWIRSGELAAVNVARSQGGKPRWRITSDALLAFELLRQPQPRELPQRRRRKQADEVVFY
jgi:excisionase family DNA binding protein